MRVGGKFAGQLFLKLPKHVESSYAVDARRNVEGAASVKGLIYNVLLFVTAQNYVQTNFHFYIITILIKTL